MLRHPPLFFGCHQNYLQTMLAAHDAQQLSYFELNLETWRQLWRVTEISDILLLIADIRHPVSLFFDLFFIIVYILYIYFL